MERFDSDSDNAERFMALAKRYSDFSELTPAMLHEFVAKVVVYEADRSNGYRQQEVEIHLNFIGKFEVPAWYEDEGQEEEAPLTPQEQQRAVWRAYKRKERERKGQTQTA